MGEQDGEREALPRRCSEDIGLRDNGRQRERRRLRSGGFTSTASRSRASEEEAGSPFLEVEGQKEDLPLPRNQHLEELAEGWWNAQWKDEGNC